MLKIYFGECFTAQAGSRSVSFSWRLVSTKHGHSQEFAVIIRNGNQMIAIKNFHLRGLEGHEFFFAKLSQHTIEMNGGEPQCVGKLILCEWTTEAVGIANTASAHPIGQFQHKIRSEERRVGKE